MFEGEQLDTDNQELEKRARKAAVMVQEAENSYLNGLYLMEKWTENPPGSIREMVAGKQTQEDSIKAAAVEIVAAVDDLRSNQFGKQVAEICKETTDWESKYGIIKRYRNERVAHRAKHPMHRFRGAASGTLVSIDRIEPYGSGIHEETYDGLIEAIYWILETLKEAISRAYQKDREELEQEGKYGVQGYDHVRENNTKIWQSLRQGRSLSEEMEREAARIKLDGKTLVENCRPGGNLGAIWHRTCTELRHPLRRAWLQLRTRIVDDPHRLPKGRKLVDIIEQGPEKLEWNVDEVKEALKEGFSGQEGMLNLQELRMLAERTLKEVLAQR